MHVMAMGALSFNASDVKELEAALAVAMAEKKPTVIVCGIDREEIFELKCPVKEDEGSKTK